MAGKSDFLEDAILALVLHGTGIAGIADNAGASPEANLHFALHYADPTDAGTQSSSEASYPGYARESRPRDNTTFTLAGGGAGQATLAAEVAFTESTGAEPNGGGSLGFWSLGKADGTILYSGAIVPALSVAGSNVTPKLTTGTVISET